MPQRKWIEITVLFDDGWVHVLKREEYMDTGVSLLRLDAIRAVRTLAKELNRHLEEAEG